MNENGIIDVGDPLEKRAQFVFAVANARLNGELSEIE